MWHSGEKNPSPIATAGRMCHWGTNEASLHTVQGFGTTWAFHYRLMLVTSLPSSRVCVQPEGSSQLQVKLLVHVADRKSLHVAQQSINA